MSLIELFRVSGGASAPGVFELSTKQTGELFSILVPRPNVNNYFVNPAPTSLHWLDTDDPVNSAIGVMHPDVGVGQNLPFLLYISDQRSVDILGYDIDPGFIGLLGSPPQVSPIEGESGVSLTPSFGWGSPLQGSNRFIVSIYNGPSPTEDPRILESPLLDATDWTASVVLQPETSYWWAVSVVGPVGQFGFSGLRQFTTAGSTCDSIDYNNDGSLFDQQDIDAFISVYSEGPCIPSTATCNDIDFNNDSSLFDICDLQSFFLVYSEGPCTPCGE